MFSVRSTMRAIQRLLIGLAIFLVALRSTAESVRLADGQSHEWSFKASRLKEPLLIWLRGRIVLPEGEQRGGHVLHATLNGEPLIPQTAALLNTKDIVYDGGRKEDGSLTGIPTFDAATGCWYLKADSDLFAYNQTNEASPYACQHVRLLTDGLTVNDGRFGGARRQHFYEYLWEIKPGGFGTSNTLSLAAHLTGTLTAFPVEISSLRTAQPEHVLAVFFR